MNEILHRRELKRVLKLGIPKHIAIDIVNYALEIHIKGANIERVIDYAIDLKFNLGLSVKSK